MGRNPKWGKGEPTSHVSITIPTRLLERALLNEADISMLAAEAIIAKYGYGDPTAQDLDFMRRQLENVKDQINLKTTMHEREIIELQTRIVLLEQQVKEVEESLAEKARVEQERTAIYARIATRDYNETKTVP